MRRPLCAASPTSAGALSKAWKASRLQNNKFNSELMSIMRGPDENPDRLGAVNIALNDKTGCTDDEKNKRFSIPPMSICGKVAKDHLCASTIPNICHVLSSTAMAKLCKIETGAGNKIMYLVTAPHPKQKIWAADKNQFDDIAMNRHSDLGCIAEHLEWVDKYNILWQACGMCTLEPPLGVHCEVLPGSVALARLARVFFVWGGG